MEEREAIARIKETTDYKYSHYTYTDDTGKAFDMAIKALEEQASEKRKSGKIMIIKMGTEQLRLIDADLLLSQISNRYNEKKDIVPDNLAEGFMQMEKLIKEQPIAYDVDKIVEKLEEEREISCADFDRYVEDYSPSLDAEYDDFFHKGLERAVRIVKRGGVDER